MTQVYARSVLNTDAGQAPVRILLIGMMGSGKSSVGRELATRTGWPFADNDTLVQRATGSTARGLLAQSGEPGLRRAEAEALAVALSLPPPVIAAVAAGTVLDAGNRRAISGAGFVVWLRAPVGVLVARSADADHRPWLEGDASGWFEAALAERGPLYARLADLELDTSDLDPAGATARILDAIGHR